MRPLILVILVSLLLTACTNPSIKNVTQPVQPGEQIAEEIVPVVTEKSTSNVTQEPQIIKQNITENISVVEKLTKKEKIDAVIAIGDSLTYGEGLQNPANGNWAALYAKDIDANLHNYAISGATSFSARYYQLELFLNDSVSGNKLVFLWFGANDAARFIPLEDFDANYRHIVSTIKNIPNTTLVLINIPDASKLSVAENVQSEADKLLAQYGVQTNIKVKTLTKEILSTYNDIISTIASENDLKIIDMFSYLETFDDSMVTFDRFHPNEKGHKMIEEKIRNDLNS